MEEIRLTGLHLYEKDKRLVFKLPLLVSTWKFAYPTVDIKSQLAWSHAWLVSNPKRMKKDLVRFLNNWMKSTEIENRRKGITASKPKPTVKAPDYSKIKEEEIVTGDMFSELRKTLRKAPL